MQLYSTIFSENTICFYGISYIIDLILIISLLENHENHGIMYSNKFLKKINQKPKDIT